LHTKEPYDSKVASCNECKTEVCLKMGYLLHCPECKYNLCKKCDLKLNREKIYTIWLYRVFS